MPNSISLDACKPIINTFESRSGQHFQAIKGLLAFLFILFFHSQVIAEGTANVSPNSSTITALGILPSQNRGSYLNAPDYQRIKIRINNHNRENIYYGFNWRVYNTGNSSTSVFYRLIAPNGSVVISARNWSNSGSGFISTYSSAVAGPNINGSNTSGYSPLNYNPDQNGDYYIEFWRGTSTSITAANWATSPYFDITVADTVGSTNIRNGRVNCAKWCFVAVDGSFVPDAAASSAMTYYGYTADSTVLKVTLSQGFRPIAFDVAITRYGVSNTNNFLNDRRSVNNATSPSLDSGYRVFLNLPDTNIFIYSKQPTQAQLNTPPILGCSPNYQIRFRTFQAGDVKIILDMNGTAGYQRGTSDTIIEIFNVPVGNNTYSWNGRDGLGNLVSSSTSISLGVVLLRGRFNLPMYDAEMNDSGFKVSSVLPVVINNSTLYWDDASLTVVGSGCNSFNQQNNTTGPGIDNKFVGTVTPAHAWNGNGNPTQAIPAPAVSGNNTNTLQCDDYGNVRVINTWGWVTSATANTTAGVGCLTITGTLWNDVNGSANNTFTNIFTTGESGANTGASLYATLIDPLTGNVLESVLINSTTGAYSMSTVPKYGTGLVIRITNTQGTVGNAPPALATLPSGWTNTSPLSRTFNTTNTNLTGMDFGIEQLPTPSTITASSRVNPGGTTSSTVAANSFGGTDPSSGQIDSLRITSFPTNATSITINGITYTSGTFPAGGVVVPTNSSGQPTQSISVDPVDGAVNVVISYQVKDNANKWSTSTGTATVPFTTVSVSGTVFNDVNGLTDNTVNGTGTNTGSTIYANLVNGNGNVVAVATVASNGTYSFSDVNGGNYSVVLSTTSGTVNNPAPSASLPSGWVNTGEGTATSGDGTVNGTTSITVSTANVTGVNFGIEELPTPSTITASSRVNPGGTTSSTVAANSFGGTDPSSGQIDSLRITSFPTNATSITINGTTYTSGTFPAGGVVVPTNSSGQPTQSISVDPVDGAVNVVISYQVKDNANKWSTSTGTATVPFTTVSVSGTVFNDGNGLTDGNINGTGTNISGVLYANLINGSGNVVAVATVASNGTYSFSDVNGGNYSVVLSTTSGTVNNPAPSASLPSGWVNTGEGTASSGDGTVNGATSITVSTGNVTGVNFGIDSKPTATSLTYTIATPSVNLNDTMRLNGAGISTDPGPLAGTDSEDGSLGSGSSVKIYAPSGNPLFYDANNDGVLGVGEQITDSVTISSFDPSRLIAQFSINFSTNLVFQYAFIDAAGVQGSRATYTINWLQPLSMRMLNAEAVCDKSDVRLTFVAEAEPGQTFVIFVGSSTDDMYQKTILTSARGLNAYSIKLKGSEDIQWIKVDMLDELGVSRGQRYIQVSCDRIELKNLNVIPNPSSGWIQISGIETENIAGVKIFDQTGRQVLNISGVVMTDAHIDLSDLGQGLYIVEITTVDGQKRSVKISIQ